MSYQKCPVCEGRQTVPAGFYEDAGVATATTREQCRTCHGTGIVGFPTLAPSVPPWPSPPFTIHPPAWGPNTNKPPQTGDPIPPDPVVTCRR